jgi:hypothetical protein
LPPAAFLLSLGAQGADRIADHSAFWQSFDHRGDLVLFFLI